MKVKSIAGRSVQEIIQKLKNDLHTGFKPTFAIVSMSDKEAVDTLSEILDMENIAVFGVTVNRGFTG